MMKDKIVKSLKWNVIDTVSVNIINIISMVFIARMLGPKDFGLMAMLIIFTALSEVLINSGFYQALVQKNQSVTKKDCDTTFTVNVIMSVFLYGIIFFSAELIAQFYEAKELSAIIKVYFLVLIFNSLTIVPRALLTIEFNFAVQSINNLISTLISATIAAYMAYVGCGYWALVALALIKSILTSVIYLIVSEYRVKFRIDFESFNYLFSYGSKLLLAGIVNVITLNIHALVIGKYFDPINLGYYNQAYNFSNLLSKNILLVTQKVSFPYFSAIKSDSVKITNSFKKAFSLSLFLSLPLLVGFASISNEFVVVFLGEKWLPIINLITILSISRAITPISAFNINIISAIGRSDLVLKTDIFKLPLALGMLFVTISLGIEVVALGQLVLGVVYFIMNSYYTGKVLDFGVLEQVKCSYKIVISAIIMFLVNNSFLLDDMVLGLISKVVVGASTYFVSCYLLKVNWAVNPRAIFN